MQRAVTVFLRIGDIVVEFAGYVLPGGMHDAEHGVAVSYRIDQDAHRAHIEEFVEFEVLALHLAPDTDDVFGPADDLGVDLLLLEQALEAPRELVDEGLSLAALFFQQTRDTLVHLGFQRAKGEIFELPLEQAHAEAVGQRRVDIEGFLRHPAARFVVAVLEQAQAFGAVTELYQHDPNVADYRHQQAAQFFRLLRTVYPRRCTVLQ